MVAGAPADHFPTSSSQLRSTMSINHSTIILREDGCRYNESKRLFERQLRFDVNALCHLAAESVHKSTIDIVRFVKIAEGGSNRIFEIEFGGDVQVIARLPYPVTRPRKYGLASEVATLQYLRLHDVPVPRILDWSVDVSNPLGSEYVIMEKVKGKELESVWYTMTLAERKMIIEKIVDIESRLFNLNLPANGSLYMKGSLDPGIDSVDIIPTNGIEGTDNFCVGPSAEYLWWYNGRDELLVNSGPWRSTSEALAAPGTRELAWLRQFGKPRLPREPLYREFYNYEMVDPKLQIDNLTDYLKIVPYMVPRDDTLNLPTLRHPDFSPNNIFISESGDITGIIDWQHSVILPLFVQAKIPKHFQNYGDDASENFHRPTLPENFEAMSESEQDIAREVYRRRQVHYFYLGFTSRNNQRHFQAMAKHDLIVRNQVYEAASRPWEGDSVSLKATLIQLAARWSDITGCNAEDVPIQHSEVDVGECLSIDEKQKLADQQMQNMRDHLGINIDGWIPNDLYEEAKEKEKSMKEQTRQMAETDQERKEIAENWPFQDYEEVD